jgi:hypothetical protein
MNMLEMKRKKLAKMNFVANNIIYSEIGKNQILHH